MTNTNTKNYKQALIVVLTTIVMTMLICTYATDNVYGATYPKVKNLKTTNTVYNSTTLTWKKPSKNVKGYVVKVYKKNKTKYVLIRTQKISKTKTKYVVKNLTINTKYKLNVYAQYEQKYKQKKKIRTRVKTSSGTSAFVTPSIDKPTISIAKSDISPTSVKIKITMATVSAKKAQGFTVYNKGKIINSKYIKKSVKSTKNGKTSCTYTVSGLNDGTSYKFTVKPYVTISKTKKYGSISKAVSGSTPIIVPDTPASVEATELTPTSITLTINKANTSGAKATSGYHVYVNNVKTATITTSSNVNTHTYTANNLTTGKQYTFKVTPYRTVGKNTLNTKLGTSKTIYATTPIKPIINNWAEALDALKSPDKNKQDAGLDWFEDNGFIVDIARDEKGNPTIEDRTMIANVQEEFDNRIQSDDYNIDYISPFSDKGQEKEYALEEDFEYIMTHFPNIKQQDDVTKAALTAISICNIYTYDNTAKDIETGEEYKYVGKHNKLGSCEDFARAYHYCLNKLGVPCYEMLNDRLNHDWDIVKINGNYYNVDPTYINANDKGHYAFMSYFLISDVKKGQRCNTSKYLRCTDQSKDNESYEQFDKYSPDHKIQ